MLDKSLFHKFIVSYFGSEINMEFVGHADLGRNNVYLLTDKNQVLKTYRDKRRWAAEVASLKFLQNRGLFVPKLVDYGTFQDNLCWLIMNKLEGLKLSEILDQINLDQRKELLYHIGHTLADFHQKCKVNQFGEWDENMNKTHNWLTFAEFETEQNRKRGKELLERNLPENNLFELGYSKMLTLEDSLFSVNSFALCHNDFSERNLLVNKSGNDIQIVGIIDFELSYPSDAEADLTKMVLKNYFSKDINQFIMGYQNKLRLSKDFSSKQEYYLVALSLDICCWARENAYDFYQEAVAVLEQLV